MPTRLLALALLPLLATGCLQLENDKEKEVYAEQKLMEQHNTTMARMDELYQTRDLLKQLPDTAQANEHRRALDRADARMMRWMHQYHKPADSVAHARVLAYFEQQQQSMDSVSGDVRMSIINARDAMRKAGMNVAPAAH